MTEKDFKAEVEGEIAKKTKRNETIAAFVVLILILGLIGLGTFLYLGNTDEGSFASLRVFKKKEVPAAQTTSTVAATEKTGTIEGSLTYPSEVIPATLVVYAQNIETGKIYQTSTQIKNSKYTSGTGYQLVVPVGNYYVYGIANVDNAANKKAYYDQFVVCGMSVSCKDTSLIKVTVNEAKTTSDITVGDWYNLK